MAIYMLHFICCSSDDNKEVEANACVLANSLEKAELNARELILSRRYNVKELIAYSHIDDTQIAKLNQVDAMLYLKAEQNEERCAVIFS